MSLRIEADGRDEEASDDQMTGASRWLVWAGFTIGMTVTALLFPGPVNEERVFYLLAGVYFSGGTLATHWLLNRKAQP